MPGVHEQGDLALEGSGGPFSPTVHIDASVGATLTKPMEVNGLGSRSGRRPTDSHHAPDPNPDTLTL